MPLESRVHRLFGNKIASQLLQIHSVIDANDGDIVSNIHQSPAWKAWYSSVADPGFLEGGFCYNVARKARAKFWKPRPFLGEPRPFRSF